MMKQNKLWWIKFYDSDLNSDEFNHLSTLPNHEGDMVIMIYLRICMLIRGSKTGRLETIIGGEIIPHSIDKIRQELKYYSALEISKALDLLIKMGVITIYDGSYQIENYIDIGGAETPKAQAMRRNRLGLKTIENTIDNKMSNKKSNNVPPFVTTKSDNGKNIPPKGGIKKIHADIDGNNVPNNVTEIVTTRLKIKDLKIIDLRNKEKDILNPQSVGAHTVVELIDMFNKYFADRLKRFAKLTTSNEQRIMKLLQNYSLKTIETVMVSILDNAAFFGENKTKWFISFGWFIKLDNFEKVATGQYDKFEDITNDLTEAD